VWVGLSRVSSKFLRIRTAAIRVHSLIDSDFEKARLAGSSLEYTAGATGRGSHTRWTEYGTVASSLEKRGAIPKQPGFVRDWM